MGEHRARRLAATLARLAVREARHSVTSDADQRALLRAREIRAAFEQLGPLYIKVGQMLSTRPDFVSPTTMDELGKLHDQVPPTPFTEFEPVLEAEMGRRWRHYFRHIDVDRPLGSASLAQVYRVWLTDGRPAALKIQRPGIRPLIRSDMALLRRAARLVAAARPQFNAVADLGAMMGLIFESVVDELDFTVEASNMDVGRAQAREFGLLHVPEVLLATPGVLLQDMAAGGSIRDVPAAEFDEEERAAIAHDLLAFMYHSYFVGRTFHADPHPGNIFIEPGLGAYLLDWGMVGRLDRPTSLKLALALINVAQNDGEGAAKAWVEMGMLTEWADVGGFIGDVSTLVPKVATASLEHLNFGIVLTTLLRHSTNRGIKISPVIPMLGKSFANMEGSIRCLAPELGAAGVLRAELSDIVVDLTCEVLSNTYLARNMVELLLTANSSYSQTRTILGQLSTRELQFPIETTKRRTPHVPGAQAVPALLAGLGGGWLWHRWRRGDRR
ncbi:ubiquinone biosynthesis protein [Nocardia tenerifensis]|uniref:Ubiquinone biosynthesis protein n=1 Tax=Nocardia tenerifensis TaxID=228006 RepID=A0A318KWU2_9NOCA|nr:AarF/UbiB family protein [Nocardia tenerifensis]PXX69231.1 ubiquinone biosynthesis protein [Nocardia tenerifensis]